MRVRIEGDRANEEATRLIDRLDALLHGSPCSENQRRVMYLVGFTSRSFRGVGTRTLLADQDTGLPQNHSGRKAASRNSGVDSASRGIHKERIQVCFPSVGTLQGPCRAPQGSIWHLHFTSTLPFASSPFTSAPPKSDVPLVMLLSLSSLVAASALREFVDDAGVTHTTSDDAPTIVTRSAAPPHQTPHSPQSQSHRSHRVSPRHAVPQCVRRSLAHQLRR